MRFRILITDEIDPEGVALLRAVPGFDVEEVATLPAADLQKRIGAYGLARLKPGDEVAPAARALLSAAAVGAPEEGHGGAVGEPDQRPRGRGEPGG